MQETMCTLALARRFAETTSALLSHSSPDRAFQAVAELAPANVPGAASASVGIVRDDGALETVAYSDEHAVEVDRIQCELEQGPVLTAAGERVALKTDDAVTDERWPLFAAHAARLDVRSVIARPLTIDDGLRAALVLHSPEPKAFDEDAVEVAAVYAEHAGAALRVARSADSLRRAVGTRQLIGEATGILMERLRIDSPQAFSLLVRTSQNMNVKLKTVAEQVVHTGQDPRLLRRADLPARR